jgi:hypothetical protein
VADGEIVDVQIELGGESVGDSAGHTTIEARSESRVCPDSVPDL